MKHKRESDWLLTVTANHLQKGFKPQLHDRTFAGADLSIEKEYIQLVKYKSD